ncbi:MAG: DUF2283 domain-containing protein [bacterium]|nr:DUF2283 domain-containing protein [bacterium]MXZ29739.1 DUF2283 domain-containing protein [Acidimicrobiia bacterium]MDE0668072.1 DUF2283 domain-containing protein [bacterium]MYB23849.1 DUF2283 domain-containing protein [Acidimicrobiia bacterium]MYE68091.1 DUF2283 domain-containing protein [Acidimicrobiia bacterium]
MSNMRYSYDSESDCGYIRIGDGAVARTESLTASLYVDRDGSDDIVGIEVLAVTDLSWIPQVTGLLAASASDALLVSARLRDMVGASQQGSGAGGPTTRADSLAGGRTPGTQVA